MIPGLLDGIAGAVKGVFGNDGISGLIDNITTSKEEKLAAQAKLLELQNAFETKVQEIALEREKLRIQENEAILKDMADARNREIQIATSEKAPLINKIIQPLLAILLLGSCFIFWYIIIFKDIPKEKEMIIAGIVGSLTTISMGVVGYYFGSSTGSKAKAEQLDKMMNK